MAGSQHAWDDRPVVGARLAAFWLAHGRSEDVVRMTLERDLGLDEDAAESALDQARRWLAPSD
jgi:hypothetical protein